MAKHHIYMKHFVQTFFDTSVPEFTVTLFPRRAVLPIHRMASWKILQPCNGGRASSRNKLWCYREIGYGSRCIPCLRLEPDVGCGRARVVVGLAGAPQVMPCCWCPAEHSMRLNPHQRDRPALRYCENSIRRRRGSRFGLASRQEPRQFSAEGRPCILLEP